MPATSSEPAARAFPDSGVFRTMEDALQPGWHEWQTNYKAESGQSDWQATGSSCMTTLLGDG